MLCHFHYYLLTSFATAELAANWNKIHFADDYGLTAMPVQRNSKYNILELPDYGKLIIQALAPVERSSKEDQLMTYYQRRTQNAVDTLKNINNLFSTGKLSTQWKELVVPMFTDKLKSQAVSPVTPSPVTWALIENVLADVSKLYEAAVRLKEPDQKYLQSLYNKPLSGIYQNYPNNIRGLKSSETLSNAMLFPVKHKVQPLPTNISMYQDDKYYMYPTLQRVESYPFRVKNTAKNVDLPCEQSTELVNIETLIISQPGNMDVDDIDVDKEDISCIIYKKENYNSPIAIKDSEEVTKIDVDPLISSDDNNVKSFNSDPVAKLLINSSLLGFINDFDTNITYDRIVFRNINDRLKNYKPDEYNIKRNDYERSNSQSNEFINTVNVFDPRRSNNKAQGSSMTQKYIYERNVKPKEWMFKNIYLFSNKKPEAFNIHKNIYEQTSNPKLDEFSIDDINGGPRKGKELSRDKDTVGRFTKPYESNNVDNNLMFVLRPTHKPKEFSIQKYIYSGLLNKKANEFSVDKIISYLSGQQPKRTISKRFKGCTKLTNKKHKESIRNNKLEEYDIYANSSDKILDINKLNTDPLIRKEQRSYNQPGERYNENNLYEPLSNNKAKEIDIVQNNLQNNVQLLSDYRIPVYEVTEIYPKDLEDNSADYIAHYETSILESMKEAEKENETIALSSRVEPKTDSDLSSSYILNASFMQSMPILINGPTFVKSANYDVKSTDSAPINYSSNSVIKEEFYSLANIEDALGHNVNTDTVDTTTHTQISMTTEEVTLFDINKQPLENELAMSVYNEEIESARRTSREDIPYLGLAAK